MIRAIVYPATILFLSPAHFVFAQSSEENSVRRTFEKLAQGYSSKDPSMILSCYSTSFLGYQELQNSLTGKFSKLNGFEFLIEPVQIRMNGSYGVATIRMSWDGKFFEEKHKGSQEIKYVLAKESEDWKIQAHTVGGFYALLPHHKAILDTADPTFSWETVPEAGSYSLFLYKNAKTSYSGLAGQSIWIRQNIQGTSVAFNDDSQATEPLRPGISYAWQVFAFDSQKKVIAPCFFPYVFYIKSQPDTSAQLDSNGTGGSTQVPDNLALVSAAAPIPSPSPTPSSLSPPLPLPSSLNLETDALSTAKSLNSDTSLSFFTDVTKESGVLFSTNRGKDRVPVGAGAAFGDFNNDDWADLYVTNVSGSNALFQNNKDGTFIDVTEKAGVSLKDHKSNGASFADYDNDGLLDLYVTGFGNSVLFHNKGDGAFEDITSIAGVANEGSRGMTASWGDYDKDGFLDLFIANYLNEDNPTAFSTRDFSQDRRPSRLYHNKGGGTFEEVSHILGPTELLSGAGFVGGWVDYDSDGDLDLYVVNDFGMEIQPNILLRNDGSGPNSSWVFTDVSSQSKTNLAIFGMGLAVGDYDRDGFLDMYITNILSNALLHNKGNGTFEEVAAKAGVNKPKIKDMNQVGWGTFFFDYDNDGYEDLYLVSGFLDMDTGFNHPEQPNSLFKNNQDGTFKDISEGSGADHPGIGRGTAYADIDNDGDLDLYIANLGQPGVLLRNNTEKTNPTNRWLIVQLIGNKSNRNGIGARIKVATGGQTLIREITSGSSHLSQNDLRAHFGLGDATMVDALEIRWPDGTVQVLKDIPVNQILMVKENQNEVTK